MKNKNHKILITGAAGFMGSHLFDYLHSRGMDVYGVDDLSGGYLRNVSQKMRFRKLDLRDRARTAAYLSKLKPDLIYHLAADATEGRSQFTPFSALDRNIVAYMNLLVPAIKYGLKKMVLTSSMSVYGAQQVPFDEDMLPMPEDIYGISKASMEKVTQVMSVVHGFDHTIIRPHNVYGPRQNLSDPYRNVIGIFINRLMQSKNFYIYGDGLQKRAFSYIDDVTPVIAESGFNMRCSGKIINVGSDEPVTLRKLTRAVLRGFFDNSVPKKYEPTKLPARPQEVKYAYCSHRNAEKILGFQPRTSLQEGLGIMIEWAKGLGPQSFLYLDSLDLENESTPQTWKKKLI